MIPYRNQTIVHLHEGSPLFINRLLLNKSDLKLSQIEENYVHI